MMAPNSNLMYAFPWISEPSMERQMMTEWHRVDIDNSVLMTDGSCPTVELENPTVEVIPGTTEFRIARQSVPWPVAPADRYWFRWQHDPRSLVAMECTALENDWAIFNPLQPDMVWAPFPGENVLLDPKQWQQ